MLTVHQFHLNAQKLTDRLKSWQNKWLILHNQYQRIAQSQCNYIALDRSNSLKKFFLFPFRIMPGIIPSTGAYPT